jgi:hypothetical protein
MAAPVTTPPLLKALALLLLPCPRPAAATHLGCNTYTLAHGAASGYQFDTAPDLVLAAAGGLGGGDSSSLLEACMDVCDPIATCTGVVADLNYYGGSCWAVGESAVRTPIASVRRNVSSWLRHVANVRSDRSTWWLAPPTIHVFQDSLPTAARFCQSARQDSISIAAARGEQESFQLVLRSTISRRIRVALVQPDGGSLVGVTFTWHRVGFVHRVLNATVMPNWPGGTRDPPRPPAGGCENISALSNGCALYPSERGKDAWYPDVLLDESAAPSIPLAAGFAQPLWVTVGVGESAMSGTSTANTVTVTDADTGEILAEVAVNLTVWDFSIAAQLRGFGEAAEFAEGYLDVWYPANASSRSDPAVALLPQAAGAFDKTMCEYRMPPNTWTAWRDAAGLRMLADPAQCGSKYFVVYNLAPPSANASAAYVAEQLALIAPRVALAEAAGLLNHSVIYGFDESHSDHIPAIRALFGAIKARWPGLRTMAALNFAVGPELYPVLDIWVVEYWNFDDDDCDKRPMRSAIEKWRSSANPNPAKENWGYHCWGPHGLNQQTWPGDDAGVFLNTFLDEPLIHSRLLRGWLPGVQNWDGWLYWYTNWEFGNNRLPHPAFIDDFGQNPGLANYTLARTAWDPAVPTEYGSFEDGNLIYPGKAGPVLSMRLANWRDGAEDHALLGMLRRREPLLAQSLARRLVSNSTHHVGDYNVLQSARVEAAAALLRPEVY